MTEPSTYAKAIDVIQRRGWTQGVLMDTETGAVCALGALYVACHGGPWSCQTDGHDHFADGWFDQLSLQEATGCTSVDGWNDAPDRTVEDVILLLKHADAGELDTWRKLYQS